MNFCATCGRQRTGDARFCDDCGTAFAPAAAAAPSAAPQPSTPPPADDPTRWDPPVDATRAEQQPDATRLDPAGTPATPAAAEPDPFASWFAADPPEGKAPKRNDPPGQWQPAGGWNAADTVYAAPAPQRGAASPPQPQRPPYGAQPVPPADGTRSSGGRKAAFIIVVVLVMLAAGGGAYALVSRSNRHTTAQPTGPAVTASASTTPTGQASTSASPSTGTSTSTSASPTTASTSPSAGVVSVAPGIASNPAEPAVETTLTNYFQGINTHNYAEYSSALDPQALAGEPESRFDSGYATTADSGMTLTSLASTANGGLAATVTFTSHQDPSASIDNSPCNNWTLTFFLVQQGADYLQGLPPSGYHAVHSDC
jgi:hypothetical protein